jgi:hypothetical protein
VTTVHIATGARQVQMTAVDGTYHAFGLVPGEFRLEVSKPGFRTLERSGVLLRVGDHTHLDLTLELGDVSQTLEVTASAPLLDSSSGTVSFVVEQQKVVNLPLDGRNFIPLIALAPGVSLPPGSVLPRINGSRPRVSEYVYDGISVLQPEPGQVPYFPIIDAIEEFRVETNSYSAEYGRANGGVILVNQKSGSNQLHGTLFEFFRNEALNARNLLLPAAPRPGFAETSMYSLPADPGRRTALSSLSTGKARGSIRVRSGSAPCRPQRRSRASSRRRSSTR